MNKLQQLIDQSVNDVRTTKLNHPETQISDLVHYLVQNYTETQSDKHFETFLNQFTKQERDKFEDNLRESYVGHSNIFNY